MLRESHLTSIKPTDIGTTKITGSVIDFGKVPSVTIGGASKDIAPYDNPVRFGGLKIRVVFPMAYTGTMTVVVNAGDASASVAPIATFTAGSSNLTGEYYEAYVPENAKRYMSIDVTPSVALAGNKVYAEFVPNV